MRQAILECVDIQTNFPISDEHRDTLVQMLLDKIVTFWGVTEGVKVVIASRDMLDRSDGFIYLALSDGAVATRLRFERFKVGISLPGGDYRATAWVNAIYDPATETMYIMGRDCVDD